MRLDQAANIKYGLSQVKRVYYNNKQIWDLDSISYPKYYFFDFGTPQFATLGADINGNYWNNFSGNASIFNIINSKNETSNIDIYSATGYNFQTGLNPGGLLDPSGVLLGDLAISSVTRDYYFRTDPIKMGFEVNQLDNSKIYDFSFFGTRETTITRITAYVVSGRNMTASGDLITSGPQAGTGGYSGNNDTILNIKGIQPSNGKILFYLTPTTGGFSYLNAMKITENLSTINTLAIGGSIINQWNNISSDLSQQTLNLGFNGSTVKDWLPNSPLNYWNTKIVENQNSNPVMLVYLGSNDISNNDTADIVYNNSTLFLNELLNLNSNSKIIYLSIIRSPSKKTAGKISIVNSVNNQISGWISNLNSRVYYADINTYLADINGDALSTGLFQDDGRHLTPSGYSKLTQVVKPLLANILNTGITDSSGYNLVWMDDFNGTTINSGYWSVWDHYEGANSELQFYTSRTGVTGNINVSGSNLYLTARSGSYTSQGPWMGSPATTEFTSALVESLNKKEFMYGKIESRIKIPSGQGLWPAFWLLGSNFFDAGVGYPLCGEIDIMEHANIQPNYTAALHTFNRNHTIPAGGWVQGKELPSNYNTQFYTYGAEWTTGYISFYINNTGFYTVTKAQAGTGQQNWPFDQPFWIKLNLAVGGPYGQNPSGGTYPYTMEVDWVKVYQKNNI